MLEQDYVNFCNETTAAEKKARQFLQQFGVEDLRNFEAMIRFEHLPMSAGYAFMRAVIEEEIDERTPRDEAFEDAVTDFVLAKDKAMEALASALLKMPDSAWTRARKALGKWGEDDAPDSRMYRRVVEMVDYERERTAPVETLPREVPF